ncbi:MAG TPA: FemAB family XrtA/PEP-CTERM system-associated protein [Dongiaceae bacterium]|nr:FemAB family XrtA/PEP-CTERM system-associated protein [Dongiaceae bacterium]
MTQEQRIKLPVDLAALPAPLNTAALERLQAINATFDARRAELKQLELEKGISSRKIGEAKKAGAPADEFLEQVRQLSEKIKAVKAEQDQLQAEATELLATPAVPEETAPAVSAHFLPPAVESATAATATVQIVIADAALADAWNAFVSAHPRSCVYHRYEFRTVIERSFGHSTHYLTALDAQRNVRGILPAIRINSRIFGHYMVSIPFFNYGGALADDEATEQALMQHLNDLGTTLGVSHIEYRDTRHRADYQQKTEKSSMVLQLPAQADQLWDDIGTKVRAQIKKAQSGELTFKSGRHELLDDFYHVFAINMRDLGTPVYAKDFFRNLLDANSLDTRLAIAYHRNRPVSCGFLIRWHDTVEIPWASTLREANALNANMFLYWNVLKHAIESGAGFFDFGRSSKDAGTFKFKQQWGAQPQQLYWHYWLQGGGELPALNPNNPKFQLAIAVWQRLPVWLTKLIGPHLVKNLP